MTNAIRQAGERKLFDCDDGFKTVRTRPGRWTRTLESKSTSRARIVTLRPKVQDCASGIRIGVHNAPPVAVSLCRQMSPYAVVEGQRLGGGGCLPRSVSY